jgi:hypothetical protein
MNKKLFETDYVIYDEANDHVLQFSNGDCIIYGDINEALEDCLGNERVVNCTQLAQHWTEIIIKQINQS